MTKATVQPTKATATKATEPSKKATATKATEPSKKAGAENRAIYLDRLADDGAAALTANAIQRADIENNDIGVATNDYESMRSIAEKYAETADSAGFKSCIAGLEKEAKEAIKEAFPNLSGVAVTRSTSGYRRTSSILTEVVGNLSAFTDAVYAEREAKCADTARSPRSAFLSNMGRNELERARLAVTPVGAKEAAKQADKNEKADKAANDEKARKEATQMAVDDAVKAATANSIDTGDLPACMAALSKRHGLPAVRQWVLAAMQAEQEAMQELAAVA